MPARLLATLLLNLLFVVASAASSLTDGPYVLRQDTLVEVRWVCKGQPVVREQAASAPIEPACGGLPALQLEPSLQLAPDSLPQPARWAALSDIHGQADLFLRLLRAHGLIDDAQAWAWGDGVLVIVGDVLDRGAQQMEALWAIYRLAREADAAGGRVELLLGNHEAMVLAGDLRYLHPRYLDVARLLGRSYDQLFAPDTELGVWLRHRAVALRLGDSLFLHGGLHPSLADAPLDLADLNRRFRAGLGVRREAIRADPAKHWLFGVDGPVWYRGYFEPGAVSPDQIDALLAAGSVSRMVVGHTTTEQIVSLHDGRIIGIDSGLKYGDRGELLIHEQGRLWRGRLDGERLPL